MRSILNIVLFAAALSMIAEPAFARSGRQNQVPNGNTFGCEVCHTSTGGLNDFGFDSYDYTNGGTVTWNAEFANRDSDRDGYSNGEELGDVMGTWRPGQNSPAGFASNPGDPSDGLCGNGSFDGSEECEGSDLQGATCEGLGLVGGDLSCDSSCKLDTSMCTSCGDGVVQAGEDCDGGDLNGETCSTMGMGEGTLACNGCRFDTSGCEADDPVADTPDTCGDGIIQTGEQCDIFDLGSQTCATLGYSSGTLRCAIRCTFDTSECVGGNPQPSPMPNDQPAPGGAAPGGSAGTDGDLMGDSIHAEGRACSTTLGSTPGSGWLLALALGLVGIRRRRNVR